MHLVPVFILETHNQMNSKCLPKFVQRDNVSSSIKVAAVNVFGAVLKGPLKYLVAKLHGCFPNAISLPVSQNFFTRFFRRQPGVSDSSRRYLFFYFVATNKRKTIRLHFY